MDPPCLEHHGHHGSEMSLTTFPLEVIEMIIGKMCFVDLPYFLQTSKVIQVDPTALHSNIQTVFAASSYHAKYQFIPKDERKHIHKNMKEFPDMWIFWTVDDVLEKYTSPFCQNVVPSAIRRVDFSAATLDICSCGQLSR
jgi:hypothetical protein